MKGEGHLQDENKRLKRRLRKAQERARRAEARAANYWRKGESAKLRGVVVGRKP